VVLRGDRGPSRRIDVHDADEVDVPQLRVDAPMVLPHVSRADHGRAHAVSSDRHQSTPSSSSPIAPAGGPRIPRLEVSMNVISSLRYEVGSSSWRIRSSAAAGGGARRYTKR